MKAVDLRHNFIKKKSLDPQQIVTKIETRRYSSFLGLDLPGHVLVHPGISVVHT